MGRQAAVCLGFLADRERARIASVHVGAQIFGCVLPVDGADTEETADPDGGEAESSGSQREPALRVARATLRWIDPPCWWNVPGELRDHDGFQTAPWRDSKGH